MMTKEWALLQDGKIKRVVTSNRSKEHIAKLYGPDFEVADLYSLPPEVQQSYEFWEKRP